MTDPAHEYQPSRLAHLLIVQKPKIHLKLVTFILGQCGFYVDNVMELATNMVKVTVWYENEEDLTSLYNLKTIQVHKILNICHYPSFTGAAHQWAETNSDFLSESALKLFDAVPRENIICITSEDKALRNAFYERAAQLNEEQELGYTFDYNRYDIKVTLRNVRVPGTGHSPDKYWLIVHT